MTEIDIIRNLIHPDPRHLLARLEVLCEFNYARAIYRYRLVALHAKIRLWNACMYRFFSILMTISAL
jgi:hypothetical protein